MRGKRAKAYKKLMSAYGHTFGFREPYQIIIDAGMIVEAVTHKMELLSGLEKVLHGKTRPMITGCSVRHLFQLPTIDGAPNPNSTLSPSNPITPSIPPTTLSTLTKSSKTAILALSKTLELRRCNHHTLKEPLSEFACIQSCLVSPSGENKNCYVVATMDRELRAYLRSIPGVPLVYINRSVMIMEPMADVSWERRERLEWGKFTQGLKEGERRGVEAAVRGAAEERKRKRAEGGDSDDEMEDVQERGSESESESSESDGEGGRKVKVKEAAPVKAVATRRKGPRQPNPLSMKKKKNLPVKFLPNPAKKKKVMPAPQGGDEGAEDGEDAAGKKRRRRKHHSSAKKSADDGGDGGDEE
ncbi:Fcf1-domain-containing protein [Peziza echinospora]|nr:Fcf1-domain-containing protein [Peziza echinospora]